jgi:hypothetical protein
MNTPFFRNQYIISSHATDELANFHSFQFCGLFVQIEEQLRFAVSDGRAAHILMIGFAFDSLFPEKTMQQIADELTDFAVGTDDFFKYLQSVTGRYAVFVGQSDLELIVGDACMFRQVLIGSHHNDEVYTSSLSLFLHQFKTELRSSDAIDELVTHPDYTLNQCASYSPQEIDVRFKRLIPNHCYHSKRKEVVRIKFFWNASLKSDDDCITAGYALLKNSYQALLRDFVPYQPLTAGIDSRVLLAASKDFQQSVNYYLFNFNNNSSDVDSTVANQIASDLKLNFRLVTPSEIRPDFSELFENEHVLPRILDKTRCIQYHFDHHRDQNILNINGNGGEIFRYYYGYSRRDVPHNRVYYYSKYWRRFELVEDSINEWYAEAWQFAKQQRVYLLDLFYWELKMGTWGALYPFEQDIAIEEYSPFNNREFILTMLQIDPKNRKMPQSIASRLLIEKAWPELNHYPINPVGDPLKGKLLDAVHGSSFLIYLAFRYRHLLS